jgi:hypothetical protein
VPAQFVNCIFVEQEVRGDDTTAIDSVVNADRERAWLIAEEKVGSIHSSAMNGRDINIMVGHLHG